MFALIVSLPGLQEICYSFFYASIIILFENVFLLFVLHMHVSIHLVKFLMLPGYHDPLHFNADPFDNNMSFCYFSGMHLRQI